MTTSYFDSSTIVYDGDGIPDNSVVDLSEAQERNLIKMWLGCFVLSHRLYGPTHQNFTDLNTIRDDYIAGSKTAMESQALCHTMHVAMATSVKTQLQNGDWAIGTRYKIDEVQTDELIALSGVASGSVNLGSFTGSTIPDDSTLKEALQELETALEDLEAAVTEVDGNVDDLVTLSGVAENSSDLGTFTGSTIADNETVKGALQDLEDKVEVVALLDGSNIPGPYASDAAAGTGGVPVGGLYLKDNGQVHWRVS